VYLLQWSKTRRAVAYNRLETTIKSFLFNFVAFKLNFYGSAFDMFFILIKAHFRLIAAKVFFFIRTTSFNVKKNRFFWMQSDWN
jgi:hypothetical protein